MLVTSVMSAYFHSTPGRMRVHVPHVKRDIKMARALEANLSRLKGVRRVESRELTGSVVVHYDPTMMDNTTLLAAIGVAPAAVAALTGSRQTPQAGMRAKIAEGLVWYVIEKAAERALPLAIAALF